MKINLDIGHCAAEGGAVDSSSKINEYSFWGEHWQVLAKALRAKGHATIVSNRQEYGRSSYDAARASNLAACDLTLSLHLNSYNGKAEGCEVLHWHANAESAQLAARLSEAISKALGNPNRGAKAKKREDRGGTQIARSIAPCLIIEPCFIDNPRDFARLQTGLKAFAEAIAESIGEDKKPQQISKKPKTKPKP